MEERVPRWLEAFDKPPRLLLHALMSGTSGPLMAYRMLKRMQSQQIPGHQPFDWTSLVATLCREEPTLQGLEQCLTMKPLLLLLPLQCQRNLLRFLHMAQPLIPRPCLSKLIEAVGHDTSSDAWIPALRALLQRGLAGESSSAPLDLLTDQCRQQLRDLFRGIPGEGAGRPETESRLGWYRDSWHKDHCTSTEEGMAPEHQNSRKRKNPDVGPDSPPWALEDSQQAKKSHPTGEGLDIDLFEGIKAEATMYPVAAAKEDKHTTGRQVPHTQQNQTWASGRPTPQTKTVNVGQQTAEPDQAGELPESIKVRVPRLKELLETDIEMPEVLSVPELQVLNECDSAQLAILCSLLQVSTLSEQALLHFCTKLQTMCPDLSYKNAGVLSKSLFMDRVLLLTEPASRLLITALTVFCSKYAQATCSTLIGQLLLTPEKGPVQVELLCRIIEECLEPENLFLVFSEVLEVPWSEDVITVLHSLMGRVVELSSGQFDLLIRKLSHWAPEFVKSMKFAKLMLTVLTKYQSYILVSHHKPLSSALALNETFLKKSLQAALRRLPAS